MNAEPGKQYMFRKIDLAAVVQIIELFQRCPVLKDGRTNINKIQPGIGIIRYQADGFYIIRLCLFF
jgi:hypothetical protein